MFLTHDRVSAVCNVIFSIALYDNFISRSKEGKTLYSQLRPRVRQEAMGTWSNIVHRLLNDDVCLQKNVHEICNGIFSTDHLLICLC